MPKNRHAVALGKLGGAAASKLGREHYDELGRLGAASPNTGRPRLPDDEVSPAALYQRERRTRLKRKSISPENTL